MSTEDYTQRILSFLGHDTYRPRKLRAIARDMGIAENEYGHFRDTVKALAKSGRIVMGASNVVTLPEPSGDIVGTFRLNPRGFGFIIPDTPNAHGDLYVPPGDNMGAITGDTVQARVLRRGKRGGKMLFEGRINKIVTRGQSQFVGELCNEFRRWFVRCDGNTLHGPVFVDDPGAKFARDGDQVVIEVTKFPQAGVEARGVIVRVLGKRGEPEVDTLSMIVQYQLPEEFPPDVLEEAHQAAAKFDPDHIAKTREDLRDLEIITIDPDDARDFDDAISVSEIKGGFELGVHIADVSHFVPEGGALDDEAKERSTSTYFPRFVIPMLPETLSNGVCSLQERVPRLAKSAFIKYDRKGKVRSTRFANTVIHSTKRLTYRQASAILDGKPGRLPKNVVALVERMDKLARIIRKRRIAAGMLVLDLPGVDLVFDDNDHVVGVTPEDTSFSHTIIEMFMVEANEAVGRLLAELGVPALRRIHPPPDDAALESLAKFLAAAGLKVPADMDRFETQSVLKRVVGKPESYAVNLAALRSMQRAEYSPKIIGHYALAGEHYVHFTSPIRRYPDLTIHRLLDRYIKGKLKKPRDIASAPSVAEVTELGAHCSSRERRAESAERELRLVKVLRLLEDQVGDRFEGVVTGVTNFGMYVQLREYLVEGLLRFDELSDDWWEVDTQRGCVVAQRSGERIRIGQLLNVSLIRVDIAARQMDLGLTNSRGGGRKGGGRKAGGKKSGRQKATTKKTGGPKRSTGAKGKSSRKSRSKRGRK